MNWTVVQTFLNANYGPVALGLNLLLAATVLLYLCRGKRREPDVRASTVKYLLSCLQCVHLWRAERNLLVLPVRRSEGDENLGEGSTLMRIIPTPNGRE